MVAANFQQCYTHIPEKTVQTGAGQFTNKDVSASYSISATKQPWHQRAGRVIACGRLFLTRYPFFVGTWAFWSARCLSIQPTASPCPDMLCEVMSTSWTCMAWEWWLNRVTGSLWEELTIKCTLELDFLFWAHHWKEEREGKKRWEEKQRKCWHLCISRALLPIMVL